MTDGITTVPNVIMMLQVQVRQVLCDASVQRLFANQFSVLSAII